MNQHDLDADQRQQNNVTHDRLLEFFVCHGVAAVLDDNDLVMILTDVGKCCIQHLRTYIICNFFTHGFFSCFTNDNRR